MGAMALGGLEWSSSLLLLVALSSRGVLGEECRDEPGFVDTRGYSCEEWTGHDCIKDAGVERYDTVEVLMLVQGCRKTCRLCGAKSCHPIMVTYGRVIRTCEEGENISSFGDCTTQCEDGYIPSVPTLRCVDGNLIPPYFDCFEDVRQNLTGLCSRDFTSGEEMTLTDGNVPDGCHLKGPSEGPPAVIRSTETAMGVQAPMLLGEGQLLITGHFLFRNVRISASKNLTFRDAHVQISMAYQQPKTGAIVRSAAVISCRLSVFDPSRRQAHAARHYMCYLSILDSSRISIYGARSWLGVYGDTVVVDSASELHMSSVGYMPPNFGVEGGGVSCGYLEVTRGSLLSANDCFSSGSGGGIISIQQILVSENSTVQVLRAEADYEGGGIFCSRMIVEKHSQILVERASASRGGCIAAQHSFDIRGDSKVVLRLCEASSRGGAIFATGPIAATEGSSLLVMNSSAQLGSAINSEYGHVVLHAAWFFNLMVSETGWASPAVYAKGNVTLHQAEVFNMEMPLVFSLASIWVGELRATDAPATLLNKHGRVFVSMLRCGAGHEADLACTSWPYSVCCKRCEGGWVQWHRELINLNENVKWYPCQRCPPEVWSCTSDTIIFPSGFRDGQGSLAHRCPNPSACPGGSLPPEAQSRPMCARPYRGPGCADCAIGYGRSESNPFVCVVCGETAGAVILRWLAFITIPGVVFLIALRRVTKATRKRESSVLLNQIMSFATLASIILHGLRHTPAYRQVREAVPEFLTVVDSSSTAAESVSGSSLRSVDCLLMDLGLQGTVLGHNVANTLLALALVMLGAAISSPTVSFLTAINCCMPSLCASFSRHMPCFHLVPGGTDHRIYRPYHVCGDNVWVASAGLAVLVCLLGGPGLWFIWTFRDDTRRTVPGLHRYAYRKGFEFGESLVILRKALLRLAATTSPMTYSPGSQLFYVMLVILASFFWQCQAQPYAQAHWNQRELALLSVSLLSVCCVSYLGDPDWGHSERSTWMIIALVTTITLATLVMLLALLTRRLYEQLTEEDDGRDHSSTWDSIGSGVELAPASWNPGGEGQPSSSKSPGDSGVEHHSAISTSESSVDGGRPFFVRAATAPCL